MRSLLVALVAVSLTTAANANSVIQPGTEAGRRVYSAQCAACHGMAGGGPAGLGSARAWRRLAGTAAQPQGAHLEAFGCHAVPHGARRLAGPFQQKPGAHHAGFRRGAVARRNPARGGVPQDALDSGAKEIAAARKQERALPTRGARANATPESETLTLPKRPYKNPQDSFHRSACDRRPVARTRQRDPRQAFQESELLVLRPVCEAS